MNAVDYVATSVAADKFLGLTDRQVRRMCEQGMFKTAHRPGGPKGNWRILKQEIITHLMNSHVKPHSL